jgi:hypothetical protein
MQVDDNSANGGQNRTKTIPKGYIILSIFKNLQRHPKAPQLWHKHINDILETNLILTAPIMSLVFTFSTTQTTDSFSFFDKIDNFLISAKTT